MLPGQRDCCNRPWGGTFCMVMLLSGVADGVAAQEYSYNLYGTPGLIDMPSAQSAADAELAASVGYFAGTTRTTLSFQVTPRLSGSFRYARIDRWLIDGTATYDRSFDLRYRFVDEGAIMPAIAIGLQDFIGTGIYSAEYLVATKQITPRLGLTGGIGWGRLGSYDGFDNPLGIIDGNSDDRPMGTGGRGGQLETGEWFRGDAALFGGVDWRATDRLTLKAEYSSDAYPGETNSRRDLFDRASPVNFGLSYGLTDAVNLNAYYLYGSEAGAALTFTVNPKRAAVSGGSGQRPTPVAPRRPGAALELDWTRQTDAPDILRDSMQRLLAVEGITLEAMTISPNAATALIRNDTYVAGAEAMGRTARIMTQVMPASVEQFTIAPVVDGVRASAMQISRTDMEQLEFAPDNAWKSYARTTINDAQDIGADASYVDGLYPNFNWRMGPYVAASYFDPNNPVRMDFGAALSASYDIAPGLNIKGSLRKRIVGNRDEDPRPSNSVIQRVRSEAPLYAVEGDPAITRLTATYRFNLAPDFYGRVTAGYLERMYGGLSTEVLWKPVNSRLGIGVELNYARQRDFDQLLGFQDYDAVTGHVSGYYDFGNSFHGQIDIGRYLAGDYGATFTLDREFDNGWRVGGYATLTDVPFEDFGEGSFDKGLRITVPLTHFLGTPSRREYGATIQPIVRDGGARLGMPDRLYETVRDYHDADLRGGWGRFWR